MNLAEISEKLKQNQVVAYPTEAVFGLGCNPLSESAVKNLLELKHRPVEKGLILIAPNLELFADFVDFSQLNSSQIAQLQQEYAHPITWVVPAKSSVPKWIKGQFEKIAVRLCQHSAVAELCALTQFPITSTSANLTGLPPCKTADEVRSQFGTDFPVLDLAVGNAQKPSEIRDLLTGKLFREG